MLYSPDGEQMHLGCTRMSRTVLTSLGLKREAEHKAFEAIYADEDLYARHIRAMHNLNPNTTYEFEIFDELPEGWRVELCDYGRHGLRSGDHCKGKYLWCENGSPYLNRYPGDTARNPEYKQALVRRK